MFRLHYNQSLENFTVRRPDRSIVCASEYHRAKLPLMGDTVPLTPGVHLIITRGDFKKAIDKKRPVLSVAVTRFPFACLLVKRIKEML
ncbi:conserved hypothetical phage protein [Salmonella phage Vi06]|uniref:Conserved hypothetical phage protein n=1 Tax=Salmonella phage Vi06 TaxID=866889 RepID=E1XU88_9CAUD|nr:hypothetical protein Vi06_09 [Salmonella phage Vi06]CBV65207.1 conserved hypothetical phage protein [Salmonella phage Vi06]